MMRARATAFALAASFSVYLIPLMSPHGEWLLGQALFQGEAKQSPRWLAVDLVVALVVQFLAWGFFYGFFRKPGWRRAVPLVLVFPFVFLALQWAYLAAIPAIFLEERDVAAEKISWPTVCTASGVYQTQLRTFSELWVRYTKPENQYAVLTMPGCQLATVTFPQPTFTPGSGVNFMIEVTSVVPEGRAIVQKFENKSGEASWWLIPGTRAEIGPRLLRLEPPAGHSGSSRPILSNDGRCVAWLESIPNSGPPVLYRVFLRPLNPDEKEKIVDLSALGPGTYFLRSLNMEHEELTLWKMDRLVTVGFDGKLKKNFAQPVAARPQMTTYMEMGKYWLAWDAYRENERYILEWSLPFGSGSHHVPLGRTIHAAAFDASGKWIAVSVGTSLNIGKAQDAVYVLSSVDGREVFRKYLPPFSRSPVAFLDGGFFAYSDLNGVRLLRIPG